MRRRPDANEASFLGAAPLFRLGCGNWNEGRKSSHLASAVAFVALTWLPLLVLATCEGPAAAAAFLLRTSDHLRMLVGGPSAILAAPVVGVVLGRVAHHFVEAGIVRPPQAASFLGLQKTVAAMSEGRFARVAALLIAYGGAMLHDANGDWTRSPTLATLLHSHAKDAWYLWISRPLLDFVLLRWLWRLVAWTTFLFRTSRLPLALSASHPDRAGGLGFLAQAQASFALVAFVFSVVWTAGWRDRLAAHLTTTDALKTSLPIFAVALMGLFVGPSIVFVPKLFVLKQRASLAYDRLGIAVCRRFEQRWLGDESERQPDGDEALLATSDISSLADLQTAVGTTRALFPFPTSKTALASLAVGIALPMVPLVNLVVPLRDLVERALLPLL
ncbi:MAG TPA: hypothetical protein VJT73_10655 [Polyangiaceae bacterium]|nr:hypothetical protein [Polyangiaceae bacterium]